MQIFTYKDFLKDKGIITFEEAEKIYDELIKSVNIHDPEFQNIWKELIEYVLNMLKHVENGLILYRLKNKMHLDDSQEQIFIIQIRDNLILLEDTLRNNGNDTSWFDEFHDDRKRMGDFANYLNYVYAVNARNARQIRLLRIHVPRQNCRHAVGKLEACLAERCVGTYA
jgi:polyhydroxyalkanoate synthesis regulator phasin